MFQDEQWFKSLVVLTERMSYRGFIFGGYCFNFLFCVSTIVLLSQTLFPVHLMAFNVGTPVLLKQG